MRTAAASDARSKNACPIAWQISQRADAMRDINRAVKEVADIFNDLAQVVHQQGDMVENIAGNVTDAVSVAHAHGCEARWCPTDPCAWWARGTAAPAVAQAPLSSRVGCPCPCQAARWLAATRF